MSEAKTVTVELAINLMDTFGCIVCQQIIQTPAEHRQCRACHKAICIDCIRRLPNVQYQECPGCRSKAGFGEDSLARLVYPKITVACTNAGCAIRVITLADHVKVCMHRQIPCILCNAAVTPMTIHAHLLENKCPGMAAWERGTPDKFGALINKLAKGDVSTGGYIDLGPKTAGPAGVPIGGSAEVKADPPADPPKCDQNSRILYLWRGQDTIRMMCVQLSSIASEEKVVCVLKSTVDEDNMRKVVIRVSNAENIGAIKPVSIGLDELATYNCYELGPGVHSFEIGQTYLVCKDGFEWAKAVLMEVLHNPSRGSFVTKDSRAHSVVIALDAEFGKQIRMPAADGKLDRSDMVRGSDLRGMLTALRVMAMMGDAGVGGGGVASVGNDE